MLLNTPRSFSGWTNKRYIPIIILVYLLSSEVALGAGGKIAGRIIDEATDEPLPAANIMLLGTILGTSSDIAGNYYVLNLPPRTYDIRVTMMGYTPIVKKGVEVNANHTTVLDFALTGTVLEAGEEVVVTVERDIVKMDVVSGSQIIGAEEIANTPNRGDFDQVFMNQAGWGDYSAYSRQALTYSSDRFGVRAGTGEDQGFEVRGGGEWQVNLMVDGMSMKDLTSGYQFTKLNLGNIQEVELLTGGFNAEYGEARAGVINVITKEGDDKFFASVDIKTSPPGIKHFGPMVNDTTASVFNFDYGAQLGYGRYWAPDSEKYVYFEGTTLNGNDYFTGGWIGRTMALPANHPWYPILQGRTHEDTLEVAGYLREEYSWLYRPELWDYGNNWDYNIETSISGAVPFVNAILGKTTYFASYRNKYSEWMYPRSGGRDGGYNDFSSQLKLTSHPTSNVKIWYNQLYAVQWGGFEYRTDLENFAFGHVLETPIQEFNQLGRGDFAETWREPDHNG